jgi:hypothetical protein
MYRSENNFGSSSEVPGTAPGQKGGGGDGSGGGGSQTGTEGGGGSKQSFGLTPGELTDSGNTSSAANIGLLLLIALIAVGAGVFAVRARRTSPSS